MEKEQERSLEGRPQEVKASFSGRRSLAMVKSLKNAMVATAVQPIVSLKSIRVNRESGSKLLAFAIKVAALEIIRRRTQIRCPPIWAFIQSLPLLRIPPFSWLQHWGPLNYLLIGSQVNFSTHILPFHKQSICYSPKYAMPMNYLILAVMNSAKTQGKLSMFSCLIVV